MMPRVESDRQNGQGHIQVKLVPTQSMAMVSIRNVQKFGKKFCITEEIQNNRFNMMQDTTSIHEVEEEVATVEEEAEIPTDIMK